MGAVRKHRATWLTLAWLLLVAACSSINGLCGYFHLDGRKSTAQCLRLKGSAACVDVPQYCPSFGTINTLSTRWMGKIVGNGGPILLLLPALLVLALSPRAIPSDVLANTRVGACAAITMFLFAADAHRFLVNFQDFLDPSGHLLVYGCGMLGTMPLVAWASSRVANGKSRKGSQERASVNGASISSVQQTREAAEAEAEEGLAAAVGVLVLLVVCLIAYFSAVTAAFFHTWLDTLVPALLIAATATTIHMGLFNGAALSDGVLPWWLASKLCVFAIAASRFVPPLASALRSLGIPFDTRHGQMLPLISAKTMGITFAYDVGLVCLYVFWLRSSVLSRQKSE